MRRDTYLNIVLTLIAVLLTADLWVRIAERPLVADTAVAQSRSQANRLAPRKTPPQKGVSAIGTEAIDQRDFQKSLAQSQRYNKSMWRTFLSKYK